MQVEQKETANLFTDWKLIITFVDLYINGDCQRIKYNIFELTLYFSFCSWTAKIKMECSVRSWGGLVCCCFDVANRD